MDDLRLGVVESRFADIIWSHEPLSSRELVILCEKELRWKKSTTYTVLKRLCDRGLFQNSGGQVTSLVSREEFYARQSEAFVEVQYENDLLEQYTDELGSTKSVERIAREELGMVSPDTILIEAQVK